MKLAGLGQKRAIMSDLEAVPCYICKKEIELDDSVWADSKGEVNNPLYAYCVSCLPNQREGK